MNYATKRKIRSYLKNLDEKYLGSFIKRKIIGRTDKKTPQDFGFSPEEWEQAQQELIGQINLPIPSDRDVKRVEIIILKYKSPEMEAKCVQHLIENTQWPFKINLFDNRPGTKNMSKILNKLFRETTCDYFVVMDSDCFVPKLEPCWLTRCMETFEKYPDCYVVSPAITRIGCPQQRASAPRNSKPEKFIEVFANPCSLHRKDVFEKVGYYDENFLIYGSDVEWSYRLLHTPGCSAYLRPDVLVDHIYHGSVAKAGKEEVKFSKIKSVEKEYANELFEQKTKGYNSIKND